MGEVVIEADGLGKSYGITVALDGLSLRVEAGEVLGIVGPNGAGKTTAVECLVGVRRPDRGWSRVLGLDPAADCAAVRLRVGAQLQHARLPARLRVGEALEWFASMYPHPLPWRELAGEWGLGDRLRVAFGDLSGGLQQRLSVALALVGDPEMVFLDEISTGLDPEARRTAWDRIAEIRSRGRTVVLVTHFLEEAERLCDRVLVLADGRVLAEGTPAELVARHGPRDGRGRQEDAYLAVVRGQEQGVPR